MTAHRQLPPTEQEAVKARTSMRRLSRYARRDRPLTLRVIDAEQTEPIELPAGAVAMLMDILEAMASGCGIMVIPIDAELTTVEAADILNVSRPFLIRLLEENKIPYRKVGKHRRIRLEDVMNYKEKIDEERRAILDQLVAEAQEQGVYD
ncbi:MAG: helix-turn-helix domain-containing protein [Chloroflexi bacterium]|nr:helix-turn-helix domain-containing protein [Chloroflexota bacterium]